MIRIGDGSEIDVETAAALASGAADPSIVLLLECAVEMRAPRPMEGATIAGVVLEQEQGTPMEAGALDRVFALIDAPEQPCKSRIPEDAKRELIRIPAQLKQRIQEAEARSGWKSNAGLQTLALDLGSECSAEIMRIPAGKAVPRHTHKGNEMTLCLSGGFSDGIGSYGPGEVSVTNPEVTHRPIADPDGPCYVLAVTDAGLKFTGVLGLLQRLTGG